jgi:nucleotide-binding universal stress UspA family protein
MLRLMLLAGRQNANGLPAPFLGLQVRSTWGRQPIAVRRARREAGGNGKELKMGTSIICGIDGSTDSQAALRFAEQLAARLGTRLVLAHVAEPAHVPNVAAAPFGSSAGRIAVAEEIEEQTEAAERLLEQVAMDAGLAGAERRVGIGQPGERLADLADEEDAELIVVGSRGRGAFKAAFLGSVSNSLVGVARCPVVVVPRGAVEGG